MHDRFPKWFLITIHIDFESRVGGISKIHVWTAITQKAYAKTDILIFFIFGNWTIFLIVKS